MMVYRAESKAADQVRSIGLGSECRATDQTGEEDLEWGMGVGHD